MKTFLVASAVLVSWLAIAARGQAATAPPDVEGAASALVAEAARAYDRNQLDEALRLLARAYELSPRPSILYNQAQVFRTKNDCVAALDAYQRFIATTTPDDPNRERAVNRRAEMQTCVDQQKATAPAEVPPAEPPTAAATAPGPVPSAIADPAPVAPPPVVVGAQSPTSPADDAARGRRRAMRITGWTLVGVGVVAAGAAAALAWRAHNIQEELNTGHTWSKPREDEGSQAATLARWFGAAAAVAGGGGAALLIVTRPTAATGDAPGSTATALVGWSGTF